MLWVPLLAELWAMWLANKTLGRLLVALQVNKLYSNVRSTALVHTLICNRIFCMTKVPLLVPQLGQMLGTTWGTV